MSGDDHDDVVSGPLHALLRRAVDVKASEVQATLMAFAFFFCVLSGYFVLRPIRDAFAAASGVSKLPWMFAGTLGATLLCNPFFSALVVKFPVRKFIPITYHFFVANLLVFYVLMRAVSPGETSAFDLWVGRAFFVWTSVFNFFVTSVFWCFMADVFRSEQAKRLFGFIGVGGTLGSIAGSGATAVLAQRIGSVNLLIVSMVLLELAVVAVIKFPRGAGNRTAIDAKGADREVIGEAFGPGSRASPSRRIYSGSARFSSCTRSVRRSCTSSKPTSWVMCTRPGPPARRFRRRSTSMRKRSRCSSRFSLRDESSGGSVWP